MFLVTTADQRYWRSEGPLLFLGEWCRRYRDRAAWQDRVGEVLPYHWEKRADLIRDFGYLRDLSERVLVAFSCSLNQVHQRNYSERYWRIILGVWVRLAVEIVFDRFQTIERAGGSGLVTDAFVEDLPISYFSVENTLSFINHFISDEFNYYFYCHLIRRNGKIPFTYQRGESIKFQEDNPALGGGVDRLSVRLSRQINKFLPKWMTKTVLLDAGLSRANWVAINLLLAQGAFVPSTTLFHSHQPVSSVLRTQIKVKLNDSPFESFLAEILPHLLPSCFLEGYESLVDHASSCYPRKARVIATQNLHFFDEPFKAWTAVSVEKGARLGIFQHGGNFGSAAVCSYEEHQIAIADRFFSWGWDDPGHSGKVKPLDAAKLVDIARAHKFNKLGRILWVSNTAPRYSYRLFSVPIASQMVEFLRGQNDFYDALIPQARHLILLRLHPLNYWDEEERWRDHAFPPAIAPPKEAMREQLYQSRLFVGDMNTTTFLEALAAKHPTILFWREELFDIREEAKPYFELLRKSGILFANPEAAASQVNKVFHDPLSWWLDDERQKAVRQFVARFASCTSGWLFRWRRALLDLARESEQTSSGEI